MRLGSTALATERVERRLAAILAADIAGYSRLMGADEEGTHTRVRAHIRQLVDPNIKEHGGRTVKNTGDGLLAEFPSAVNAVRCAVEIQRTMVDRNADTPEDKRISFRIGVNLGDVIIEPEDIFGDDVNIAARLEALAEPGGICISRAVRDRIGERLPYSFEDIGEQSVKNIARPVPVYAMSAATVASLSAVAFSERLVVSTTAAAQHPAIVTPRLSIVVLPFVNLSDDPEQEYFADGITDDLTTDLSRISGSFVIARNTAFTYKSKHVDVKQLGQELGVRYVIEGSVRRVGRQLSVNVQLIDADSGVHLWADRFGVDPARLAEAELTGRLARSFDLELVAAADRRITQESLANPDAQALVLRGRACLIRSSSSQTRQDAQLAFEQALAIDPQSIDAKAYLAITLVITLLDGWSCSPRQDQARAEQLLLEALEQDPNLAKAHCAMGLLRRFQGALTEAKIELERAIALDRNYGLAAYQLGLVLAFRGQPEAAIPYVEKAIRLSPREPNLGIFLAVSGACHLLLGHRDQAIDLLRRGRAASPRYWYIHFWLAGALGFGGDFDEARAALAKSIELNPEVRSLARYRAQHPWETDPAYLALRTKTLDVGLHSIGFPDE
jgi:TolB-like protein/class 3 adenylate cyclase/Tfp pilus assembly protein PilF